MVSLLGLCMTKVASVSETNAEMKCFYVLAFLGFVARALVHILGGYLAVLGTVFIGNE